MWWRMVSSLTIAVCLAACGAGPRVPEGVPVDLPAAGFVVHPKDEAPIVQDESGALVLQPALLAGGADSEVGPVIQYSGISN